MKWSNPLYLPMERFHDVICGEIPRIPVGHHPLIFSSGVMLFEILTSIEENRSCCGNQQTEQEREYRQPRKSFVQVLVSSCSAKRRRWSSITNLGKSRTVRGLGPVIAKVVNKSIKVIRLLSMEQLIQMTPNLLSNSFVPNLAALTKTNCVHVKPC